MGQFELSIADVQKEIREKFSDPNGFIQKWYTLKPRGEDDGDISGDLLIRIEIISGNTDVSKLLTIVINYSLTNVIVKLKSDALFYKWFPEIPHSETVIKGNATLYK